MIEIKFIKIGQLEEIVLIFLESEQLYKDPVYRETNIQQKMVQDKHCYKPSIFWVVATPKKLLIDKT